MPSMIPGPHSLLFIIAGPAGSGKTTLSERFVTAVPAVRRVVTATTRPPRKGETNGVDYHFMDDREFDARLAAGEFLEWAQVHRHHRYGTLRQAVLEPLQAGTSLVMSIDVQGVRSFREAARQNPFLDNRLVTVFLLPDSTDTLRRRLLKRGTDNPEEIDRRMRTAEEELREAPSFHHRIISGTPEGDAAALLDLWHAERFRRGWVEGKS